MSLYGILDAIKEKPGLFGIDSAESVFYYILGYQGAMSEYQLSDIDVDHFNLGFLDWVRKSYPGSPSHVNWLSLVLLYSGSRMESMTLFFSLLDKYRISTGLELTDPQSRFYRVDISDVP